MLKCCAISYPLPGSRWPDSAQACPRSPPHPLGRPCFSPPPQVGQALCTSGTWTRFIKTISVRLRMMKSPFILVLGCSLPTAAYQKCFHVVISLVLLVSSGRSAGGPQGLCPRQGDSSPPFSCCGTHVAQRASSAASPVWRRVSLTKILMT